MLLDLARTYPSETEALKNERKVLTDVVNADKTAIEEELEIEMRRERDADRQYWNPLRGELERLRRMNIAPEEEV
jgi:hemerythrin-like domain-containing protein